MSENTETVSLTTCQETRIQGTTELEPKPDSCSITLSLSPLFYFLLKIDLFHTIYSDQF